MKPSHPAAARRYNQTTKGKLSRRRSELFQTYGLTAKEHDELYARQRGLCAVSGTPRPQHGIGCLCVDHIHPDGPVRGLLTFKINTGIGLLGDTTEGVRAALAYLMRAELRAAYGRVLTRSRSLPVVGGVA